jgi:hypothetical protein
MKRYFFFTGILLLVLLAACSKGHVSAPSGLTGQWRELSTSGGLGGQTIRYDKEMRILQLNADSTWSIWFNGTYGQSGVYSLSTMTSGSLTDTLITFRNDASGYLYRQLLQSRDGHLVLWDFDISDGYTSAYIRWPLVFTP